MRISAFSLIELMVVISIVAILSAVAVPAYRDYSRNAKFVSVINFLDKLADDATTYYTINGAWPATLNGAAPGTYPVPSNLSATHWHWNNNTNNLGFGEVGATFQVMLNDEIGNGIPGYVASTNGADGTYARIQLAVRYNNDGTYTRYCGSWGGSSFVPMQYMPPGCKLDNIRDTYFWPGHPL